MAKKLTSALGIDIGSEFIKICEVKSQGKDPVVTAMAIVPTPEGSVDHAGIYNPDAVAIAIKLAVSESGASTQSAVVTIAGQNSVLVRTLEVPKMNPAELREHMQWEINRNIPFAESNVVSDFKALGSDDPNSTNMDVVMAISPQSAIDTIIQCVKKAGRAAAAIDVEPLSLARTLQANYGDIYGDSTVCIVDFGAKTTSINMYKGAKLLMPRQVPIGGELFTKAISDTLAIGLQEAETLKREKLEIPESASTPQDVSFSSGGSTQEFQPYNPFSDDAAPALAAEPAFDPNAGFNAPSTYGGPGAFDPMADAPAPVTESEPADVPQYLTPQAEPASNLPANSESARIYGAVASVLDEFVSEVRRSVDYFRSRGGDLNAVLVCGGGAKIPGLVNYLSKTLGIHCDTYDPIRRLTVNTRKLAPSYADQHKSELAIAIGNGLYIFHD